MIIDKTKCVGCASCVNTCPQGALSIREGVASLDENKCISCGACVGACPVEAITLPVTESTAKPQDAGRDLWVYVEHEEGEIAPVVLELLAKAKELAAACGERCAAVLLCDCAGDKPQQLIAAGADVVYVVEDEALDYYNSDRCLSVLLELVAKYQPNAFFIGATVEGREIAPLVAAKLHTGLCADCTGLAINAKHIVEFTRPALGGNILATIVCEDHKPQMGSVRPKVFKAAAPDYTREGIVVPFRPTSIPQGRTLVICSESLMESTGLKIEDAEIIVCGGRGMGTEQDFQHLRELATELHAAVAGSRAAVDEGWVGHASQIGQSGKTVTPKVYLGFGVSGAMQHISGMSGADLIIAVNTDERAPIFSVAQIGIVGNAKEIAPLLVAKLRSLKE